ncbi:VirD4-like conjugal transfer protein, CD1115 family [Lactococcus lactis]|uniref:VirD4-like conjugal transfer protein, CD1115 family n=1 Tax=Lactococcus lactis TaxID=1358 RepID=UPI001F569252|nr:type IV secretory system conjugative DNA transfer family protein [Lactococcus lactis]
MKNQKNNQPYKKKLKPYLILSGFLFILGFVIGNFFWMLPGDSIYSKEIFLTSGDLLGYFNKELWHFFYHPSFAALGCGVVFFLIGLLMFVYNNDSGIYRLNEEHGSACLAKVEDLKKYQDPTPENNMILSKNVQMGLFNDCLPQKVQKNKSTIVLGDSGAAKTLALITPNIMQLNASFVITDPDGGLIYRVGSLLKKAKYNIKILDLNTLTNSDTFNIFNYIKTELDVDRILEAITEGTKSNENQGEDFWVKAEALLVRAIIAYLWFDGRDNGYTPHLGMISDMLRHLKRDDPKTPSPVEKWFEEQNELHPDNYAYRQWTLFNDLFEAETRASVLGIAASRYSVFDHDQLRDMVRHDSMEIESWNEEKTAVFIAIPETNKSFNFIANIFLATIMETLRAKSDRIRLGREQLAPGKQLLHVRFLIDEFANIGKIAHFEEALATFRKREMSFMIILQSLAQLKKMYKNNWEEIVDNCASLIYLGGDDPKTLEFLSKRLGKQTISLRKQSISKGGNGGGSESRDKTGRDLMMVDEIATIDGDECLVFIKKEHGFIDRKYYAYEHPRANELARNPGDAHWFTYRRYMSEEEKLLEKVRRGESILNDHGTLRSEISA